MGFHAAHKLEAAAAAEAFCLHVCQRSRPDETLNGHTRWQVTALLDVDNKYAKWQHWSAQNRLRLITAPGLYFICEAREERRGFEQQHTYSIYAVDLLVVP